MNAFRFIALPAIEGMGTKNSKNLAFICCMAAIILGACSSPTPTLDPPTPEQTPAISKPPTKLSASIDDETTQLLDALVSSDSEETGKALNTIAENNDPDFISVLLELMRAIEIRIIDGAGYGEIVAGLEILSGESFGPNWPAWVEWYGATELDPPAGFTGWKGRLLGRIDPKFSYFLRDEYTSTIRVEEIQRGGVVVDGIPALNNPTMIPADQADYLTPDEPIFGIFINGDARAYPLRIMDWHEMANDVAGGVPVSLAYCTLCGAGIAYNGRINGVTYTFGSSGFLYRSNKLMFNRQTETLWNQLSGEPVLGELVGQEIALELLPVVLTTWSEWVAQHPETVVLPLESGYERIYLPGAAYGYYFVSETTMFPVWQRSDLLGQKDRIYALHIDGVPKAYPIEVLAEEVVVNDILASTPIVLIAERGEVIVKGVDLRSGAVSYVAGCEVRAYAREEEDFSPHPSPGHIFDSNGGEWTVSEKALLGPDGEELPRINGHLAYWFGWFANFPNTLLYSTP